MDDKNQNNNNPTTPAPDINPIPTPGTDPAQSFTTPDSSFIQSAQDANPSVDTSAFNPPQAADTKSTSSTDPNLQPFEPQAQSPQDSTFSQSAADITQPPLDVNQAFNPQPAWYEAAPSAPPEQAVPMPQADVTPPINTTNPMQNMPLTQDSATQPDQPPQANPFNPAQPQDATSTFTQPGQNDSFALQGQSNPFGPSANTASEPALTPTPESPPPATGLENYGLGVSEAQSPQAETPAPEPVEPAPTDLSQLEEVNGQPQNSEVYNPAVNAQPNLVVEGEQPSVIANAPSQSSRKLPLILGLAGAAVVVILVAGASAYFILGIGRSEPAETSSTPAPTATQPPLTNPPQQIVPSAQPIATPPAASGSSSFGELNGSAPTEEESGMSAIDRLKERQEQ